MKIYIVNYRGNVNNNYLNFNNMDLLLHSHIYLYLPVINLFISSD